MRKRGALPEDGSKPDSAVETEGIYEFSTICRRANQPRGTVI